jgi:predicted Zn-dependent peptidase
VALPVGSVPWVHLDLALPGGAWRAPAGVAEAHGGAVSWFAPAGPSSRRGPESWLGDWSIEAGVDGHHVGLDGPADQTGTMLAALASLVREAHPTAADLAAGVREHEAASGRRSAAVRAFEQSWEALWPEAVVRSAPEVVKAVTGEAVRAWHDAAVSPRGALLVITGRFDPDATIEQAAAAFGTWKAGETTVGEVPPPPEDRSRTTLELQEPGLSAAEVELGCVVTGTSWPAALVGAAAAEAELFRDLREAKGLSYDPHVGVELGPGGVPILWLHATAQPARTTEVVAAFDRALGGLRQLDAPALARARRSAASGMRSEWTSAATASRALVTTHLAGAPIGDWWRLPDALAAVDGGMLAAAAERCVGHGVLTLRVPAAAQPGDGG